MSTESENDENEQRDGDDAGGDVRASDEPREAPADVDGAAIEDATAGEASLQMGTQRYVYAAFMAGALAIALLGSKIGHAGWFRLSQWKPEIGEPKDELVMPVAAAIGAVAALYYWKKESSRQYVTEVADELSKVTWPSKQEVTSSTSVVIVTTLLATLFFALMDRFWGFVTNLVYGT